MGCAGSQLREDPVDPIRDSNQYISSPEIVPQKSLSLESIQLSRSPGASRAVRESIPPALQGMFSQTGKSPDARKRNKSSEKIIPPGAWDARAVQSSKTKKQSSRNDFELRGSSLSSRDRESLVSNFSIEPTTLVPIETLQHLIFDALTTSCSVPIEDAQIITDVLIFAELRGNNQGVVKVTTGAIKQSPDCSEVTVRLDGGAICQLNAGNRIGMVGMARASREAVGRCGLHGVAVVGLSGYASATGALGYWARQIARAGYVALVFSQCSEMVAPHGTTEAIFGTNPLSIGIPCGSDPSQRCIESGDPIVLDMATSATAYYALVSAALTGTPIPDDVAFDENGEPTTYPESALQGGAIRVFDRSYKGSGLALMVELLAGALVGADMEAKKASGKSWGSLVVAIDPDKLGNGGKEQFFSRVKQMCTRVKGARRAEGKPLSHSSFSLLSTPRLVAICVS